MEAGNGLAALAGTLRLRSLTLTPLRMTGEGGGDAGARSVQVEMRGGWFTGAGYARDNRIGTTPTLAPQGMTRRGDPSARSSWDGGVGEKCWSSIGPIILGDRASKSTSA